MLHNRSVNMKLCHPSALWAMYIIKKPVTNLIEFQHIIKRPFILTPLQMTIKQILSAVVLHKARPQHSH